MVAAADIFRKRTGHNVKITFATTPEIRRLVGAGATPDVVIAPHAALDELAKSGTVDGAARVSLGRVGVGVVIRDGAPKPDVSTTDALKRAVLDADSVIYNRASSGLYVEGLLQRLGLAEHIQAKTKRYTGTDMIEPLIKGKGNEIGFMPVAQIELSWQRPATRRSAACRHPELHALCRGTRTKIRRRPDVCPLSRNCGSEGHICWRRN